MNFYRSVVGTGDSAEAATYTATVNSEPVTPNGYMKFASNSIFNVDVTIGSSFVNCERMFNNCSNFNANVNFGANVVYCNNAFYNCSKFNANVVFKNSVKYLSGAFEYCNNLNRTVTLPQNAVDCNRMFSSCQNLNAPITITENVTNCENMFRYASNFNQPMIIPASVESCVNMFAYCVAMQSNIYLNGEPNIKGMLRYKNNSCRVNMFCNNIMVLNDSTANSVVGSAISWSSMTNGYYNAAYNVYIYNNYSA